MPAIDLDKLVDMQTDPRTIAEMDESDLPPRPAPGAPREPAQRPVVNEPGVMLAARFDQVGGDPSGWYASEKMDGVRAFWDGKNLISRAGNVFPAPDWFKCRLPRIPLDGELWPGRGMFYKVNGWVKRHNDPEIWKQIRYVCFDAPMIQGPFEARLVRLYAEIQMAGVPWLAVAEQRQVENIDHLFTHLGEIEAVGGEGLIIRKPGSAYEWSGGTHDRSLDCLKVTTVRTAEAVLVDYTAGKGDRDGVFGAMVCELADGTRFKIGTGFDHACLRNPPPLGSTVTFGFKALNKTGVPREPRFYRVRHPGS